MSAWTLHETSTHQDHVIAHVIGATVLGHFVFDESIYLLLDIGFMWRIYLDGEMGLLPFSVAIQELDANDELKQQLTSDSEKLLGGQDAEQIKLAPVECFIQEVILYADGDDRKLILLGEENDLSIETSCRTREIVLKSNDAAKQ